MENNGSTALPASNNGGNASTSEELKNLWDEYDASVLAPGKVSAEFLAHLNRQKLYQFLMGLNDSYQQARSQILLMIPLPAVNQAYGMIIENEGQKSGSTNAGNLGMKLFLQNSLDSISMYSKTGGGFNNGNQRFNKNFNAVCEFCRCKGHKKKLITN
ncbi:uncharacterized protein LOC132621250 [Lycium barbarum]|uniref:uncharacterized protein LOC132621250 n=1 Tax=Lycium barbarum TaxID=112863 RepID=UPI00293E6CF5|nr:uncharacterized protein LOC132621250 [Lycium barbarum]